MATFRGTGKSCSSNISKEHNTTTSRIWLPCGPWNFKIWYCFPDLWTLNYTTEKIRIHIFMISKKEKKKSSLPMNVQCIHCSRFVEKASVHCWPAPRCAKLPDSFVHLLTAYSNIQGFFKKFPHFYIFAGNGEGSSSSNWSCLRGSCD